MEIKKVILSRIGWVYLGTFLVALAIIGQVLRLQFLEGEKWRIEAEVVTQRPRVIAAMRGNILADDGRPLASTIPHFDVIMDPNSTGMADSSFVQNLSTLSAGLAHVFPEKSARQYQQLLERARREGKRYFLIHRDATFEEAQQIQALPLFNLGRYKGGLILDQVTSRVKPYPLLANRTIGYLNQGDGGNEVGIEGAFDHLLKGRDGLRMEHRIGGGTWMPLSSENEVEPQDGYDVISTINIQYQDVAENALLELLKYHQAHHGCAVLMEVATGEVKAIANLGIGSDGQYHEDYNYAIGELAEPGSTFKLPAIMAALEDGYVTLDDTINTFAGRFKFYDRTVTDAHTGGFGILTVREVIEKSSNIGMARLIDRYYRNNKAHFVERLYAMGLDKPLGLDLIGDPAPKIKDLSTWSGVTLPWMAHGYELSMTPLQVLTFYNAIANNGTMVKPRFVKAWKDHSQIVRETKPETLKNSICSEETISIARELLEGVVLRGTATNVRSPYFSIAGKTGTAQIAQNDRGYRTIAGKREYRASFVGYFPADNPKYSCIVVITRPNMGGYYGNKVAGTVFLSIANKVYATSLALHPSLEASGKEDLETVPNIHPGKWTDIEYLLKQLHIRNTRQSHPTDLVSFLKEDAELHIEPLGEVSMTMPNVRGMVLKDVLPSLENMGKSVSVRGYGYITRQEPQPGTPLDSIQHVVLELNVNEIVTATDTKSQGL